MHRDRPVVTESAEELKALLKQEPDRQKRQRLHALYLFASGHATTRQEAAQLLGVHRETLGRWMACYADGGLPAVLDVYVPTGKAPSLSAPVLAAVEQQLQQPTGVASYAALHVWLVETHGVAIKPNTLERLVRRRFGTRPKVVRPSHIKKPSSRD